MTKYAPVLDIKENSSWSYDVGRIYDVLMERETTRWLFYVFPGIYMTVNVRQLAYRWRIDSTEDAENIMNPICKQRRCFCKKNRT